LGSATRESQCAEGGQDARPPRGDAGNAEAGNGEAGSDDAGHGEAGGQFSLGDHRPLDEVVRQLAELGYIPSFCTACYRLGRTGQDFMDLAKPGEIRHHCDPNALSTFMEYLLDYATPATMQAGTRLVDRVLTEMEPTQREISSRLLEAVRAGQRDVFV
jgi:2-iminoacetate synthase